ncbi:MAG: prefoldin subunit alpha [Candidatus Hermodarchaeota archaeon]
MKSTNELISRLYAESEQLKITGQEMERQLSNLSISKQEMLAAKDTLEELVNHKKDEPLLIPIGGGIRLQVKIDQVEEVLTNIGSGVHINMKPKDVLTRIEENLKNIDESIRRTYESLQYIEQEIVKRESQIQQLAQQRMVASDSNQHKRE